MPRHGRRKHKGHKAKARRSRIPVYHAQRKKKQKMPENVKKYFKCVSAGKGKRFCKSKYLK